jgi:hypothetical protein
MIARRPVNSTVIAPRTYGKTGSLTRGLNGFAFSARLGADELAWWGGAITSHWTGARVSGLLIDNLRLSRLRARPVNSTVMPLILMIEKTLLSFVFLLALPLTALAQSAPQPGCGLLDAQRDSLFLTYDRSGTDGRGPSALILRLKNNSTCPVLLKMQEPKKFLISEAVPFADSKFRSDAEDGEFIPELVFLTQDERHTRGASSRAGDFSFVFRLIGGRSITFAVPEDDFRKCNDIIVLFNFEWERNRSGSPSLLHQVSFPTAALPTEVRRKLGGRC